LGAHHGLQLRARDLAWLADQRHAEPAVGKDLNRGDQRCPERNDAEIVGDDDASENEDSEKPQSLLGDSAEPVYPGGRGRTILDRAALNLPKRFVRRLGRHRRSA
jgi:hypothetical protein